MGTLINLHLTKMSLKCSSHVMYTICYILYHTNVILGKVKLEGPNKLEGNVYVWENSINDYGTVCDDHWDRYSKEGRIKFQKYET